MLRGMDWWTFEGANSSVASTWFGLRHARLKSCSPSTYSDFEIWVLRASVFVFECFVLETTPSFHGLRKERLAQWPSFWEVHVRNTLLSHIARYLPSFHAINRQRDQNNSIYGISRREYKHFESPSTENCTKNYVQKTNVLNQRAQRHSNHRSVSLESDEYKLWSEKSWFFYCVYN